MVEAAQSIIIHVNIIFGNQCVILDVTGKCVQIDWGDNSIHRKKKKTHTYVAVGFYTIVINAQSIKTLDISYSNVSYISFKNCRSLRALNCHNNSLKELDLSECKKITYLDCSYNQLSYINMSLCTLLEVVYINNNNLKSLIGTLSPRLRILICNENQFTKTTIGQIKKLLPLRTTNPLGIFRALRTHTYKKISLSKIDIYNGWLCIPK